MVRKRNFKENDQKILLKLIQDDDEIILSCLEKFKQVRDEKDLLISFQKILRNLRVNLKQNNFFIEKEQANNESINRVKLQEQVIEQNNIVKHQPLMQTNTEKPKSNIFLMKDKKNEGNPPAKIEKTNQVQVPINQKRENSTSIVGSNEEKIGSFSNFNIITFLEKNEEKFSNEQYGLIMNLSKNNDEEFKAMIYQCQNIKNQEVDIFKR